MLTAYILYFTGNIVINSILLLLVHVKCCHSWGVSSISTNNNDKNFAFLALVLYFRNGLVMFFSSSSDITIFSVNSFSFNLSPNFIMTFLILPPCCTHFSPRPHDKLPLDYSIASECFLMTFLKCLVCLPQICGNCNVSNPQFYHVLLKCVSLYCTVQDYTRH